MSELANQIYMSIVTLTTWKKQLHNSIQSGQNHFDECPLGKWLTENAGKLGASVHYEKTFTIYNRFLEETEKIIQLAESGNPKEALAAMEYGSSFENIAQELVQVIIAWREEVQNH